MKNTDNNIHMEPVPLNFEYRGTVYEGIAKPVSGSCNDDECFELDITLNKQNVGFIYRDRSKNWTLRGKMDQGMIDKIGEEITMWYKK